MKKALALFSGGLDSLLSIKIIQKQGIKVTALNFSAPFIKENSEKLQKIAQEQEFELRQLTVEEDYSELITNPPHGWGKNVNPCIDCKIYMLKKAKKIMEAEGYEFVVTGEVMGQRPKSQHKDALLIIERESGLFGKLVRPLTAKNLIETEPEKQKIIDREKLYKISGRSRTEQLELAKEYNLSGYGTPAGGCMLTDPQFSNRVKDFLKNEEKFELKDLELLKLGRQFRIGKNKIIVGRKEEENDLLDKIKKEEDYKFEAANEVLGPVTLLIGPKTESAIKLAAQLTARYCDSKDEDVLINYGQDKLDKQINVKKISEAEIEKIRL